MKKAYMISMLAILAMTLNAGPPPGDATPPPGYPLNPNDNAVLITGDTPYHESQGPINWNEGIGYEWGYDEFWNDTYLMWELACWKGKFPDNQAGAEVDHIHVLYGNGVDHDEQGERYNPQAIWGIETITDYSAYYQDVANIFDWLANGHGDLPPMSPMDVLFCWTFDHGARDETHAYLCLMDSMIRDDDFAQKVRQIGHWRQVFWMQQCHSGGFIDDLEDSTTVITTACKFEESAWRADDVSRNNSPLPENETYQGVTYHHGEFNFHIMNAVRGCAIYPYENPPPVDANMDIIQGISMFEAAKYEIDHESRPETPQHSDIGNIGGSTFLWFNPLAPPDPPTGLTGQIEWAGKCHNDFKVHLNWNDNTEPDLHYYMVYRDGEYAGWTYQSHYTDPPDGWFSNWPDPHPPITYFVTAVDIYNRESEPSNPIVIDPNPDPPGGGQIAGVGNPRKLALYGNSPNPFATATDIRYAVPSQGSITLSVYDLTGRKVKTLYNGISAPGEHTITWDGRDDHGRELQNGIYFIRLEAGGTAQMCKVSLIR